ncbi:MAG: serine--tRNA ligase, partial [Malacoplasma sp.]|nr:serine--tRNA ligase [Malacoplasma sp.]
NIHILENALKNRSSKIDLTALKQLLDKQFSFLITVEKYNQKRNEISKKIGIYIKENKSDEVESLKKEMESLKKEIEIINENLNNVDNKLNYILLTIPNIPHESVPIGKSEDDNVEIKKWGTPTKFNFQPKAHWDLINQLDIGDFERATKITGQRFFIYKGLGNKLMRALQSFTLEMHEKQGYLEFGLPVIVNKNSLLGTGQLPKFKEDLFALENTNYFLSPTLEVQLTNYYRNEILEEKILPIKFTASSINFRSEAGSAGKDTRGIVRQHQFYKTEMVNLVHPEKSYEALESMTLQAESILEALNLPYRRIVLCTGDMGFSATKTYDIEVWLPSYNSYKEISSCSNCCDFQTRRLMIRFKNKETNKNELVHSLNGTGLALDRLFAAIIENYQNEDGSITVPKVLEKYLGVSKIK